MFNLGVPQEALAARRTTMALCALQNHDIAAWRVPELPRGDAGRMPGCPAIGAIVPPEVRMPSEAKHRLTTDAAMS